MFQKSPWKKAASKQKARKESSHSKEHSSEIGNTLWCSCGKCKLKATHAESICCLDKEEILESYFEGILSFVFEIFLSNDMLVRSK